MAQHLHDQGIDPQRWVEAEPAPWAVQKHFRETGRKMDERHFEVAGRLYQMTPAVAASQRQGEDALEAYLGARPRPVEELVDVAKVPLRHPFGRPHAARGAEPDADTHALNLHYARAGVDPGRAHEGDPLPMREQLRLRAATRAADGSDIPLGIPGIYRGYDDGYFYAANDGTRESPETQQLRRDLATAKATGQADAAPIAANDNDPDIDEVVARSYQRPKKEAGPASAGENVPPADPSLAAQFSQELKALIAALRKWQAGEALDKEDQAALAHINEAAKEADRQFVPGAIDIAELERVAGLLDDPKARVLFAGSTAAALANAGEFGAIGEAVLGKWAGEGLANILTAATKARPVSGIGTFLALMAPKATAEAQPGERADLTGAADTLQLLRSAVAARSPQGKRMDWDATAFQPANDNQPGPANDNWPKPANDNDSKPGLRVLTKIAAATAASGLPAGDGRDTDDDDPTPAPPAFDPTSTDLADLQRDFGHAILQGQLPEIWIQGKRLTPPNPWGMHGSPKTRKLDEMAADRITEALAQCKGVSDVRRLGGQPHRKQIRISDIDSRGNRNSVTPDVSLAFRHGPYTCIYHINSVDTNAAGEPTKRERMSLERLKENMKKLAKTLTAPGKTKFANADEVKGSGYVTGKIPKSATDDDAEINRILENFIANDFSCAEIIRECELTQPPAAKEGARLQ